MDKFIYEMGDLFAPTVPTRWIVDVFDACEAAPQHKYMFLTKYPERYKALEPVEWIIVGAETGNWPGKARPYKEWLAALAGYAHRNNVPILLKDCEELRDVWGDDLIQEFPKGLEPMPSDNTLPHCRQCEHASSIKQGKRGMAYACEIGWESKGYDDRTEARHIPGRYTRSSPPWCPRRKEPVINGQKR